MKKNTIDKMAAAAAITTLLGTIISTSMYVKDKQTLTAVLAAVFGSCFVGTMASYMIANSTKKNQK